MEKLKEDIEQVKVQILTGIKLGRVEKEWGNMIIETCNQALAISRVVGQSEQFYCIDESYHKIDKCKKQCYDCKRRVESMQ